MYYVIQVPTGQEKQSIDNILRVAGTELVEDLFSPTEKRQRKVAGVYREVTSYLFPGYLFVKTSSLAELSSRLMLLEGFKRILYVGTNEKGKAFVPLTKKEEEWLLHLLGDSRDRCVEISKITLGEGKKVRVISGPLFGLEGNIKKLDLHKRKAIVEIPFGGQNITAHLGIEILMSEDGTED